MLEVLHTFLAPYLDTRYFKWTFGLLVFINPLALLPQIWTILTADSVAGVSMAMMTIFLAIQVIVALEGIRIKRWEFFLPMFLSAIESIFIIMVVIVRS